MEGKKGKITLTELLYSFLKYLSSLIPPLLIFKIFERGEDNYAQIPHQGNKQKKFGTAYAR